MLGILISSLKQIDDCLEKIVKFLLNDQVSQHNYLQLSLEPDLEELSLIKKHIAEYIFLSPTCIFMIANESLNDGNECRDEWKET